MFPQGPPETASPEEAILHRPADRTGHLLPAFQPEEPGHHWLLQYQEPAPSEGGQVGGLQLLNWLGRVKGMPQCEYLIHRLLETDVYNKCENCLCPSIILS